MRLREKSTPFAVPFTLIHPALVLPLRHLPRRWVSVTGLVAGSMAPDFEKFAKMRSVNHYSHTWPSLLYFTLPVGLALTFVFHLVVRNPLVWHLPAGMRKRLQGHLRFDWCRHFAGYYPAVFASLLLGGASHLLWDSFTHRLSPLAKQLPFLEASFLLGPLPVQGFELISAITSVVAVGYMGRLLMRRPAAPGAPVPADCPRRYWPTVALLTAGVFAARVVAFATAGTSWDIVITLLSAFLLSLAMAPLLGKLAGAGKCPSPEEE